MERGQQQQQQRSSKRKRGKTTNTNNNTTSSNTPDIPGVPADHVPYFIQALKAGSKFFTKRTNQPYSVRDYERYVVQGGRRQTTTAPTRQVTTTTVSGSSDTVHDTVMNRVAAVVAAAASESNANNNITTGNSNNTDHQVNNNNDDDPAVVLEERQQSMSISITRWLESIKRYVHNYGRKKRKKNDNSSDNNPDPTMGFTGGESASSASSSPKDNEEKQSSVPFSLFLFLWDITTTHERLNVRRSATLLSSIMLQKSRDCRFQLDSGTVLVDWVTIMATTLTKTQRQWKVPSQVPLLQYEARSLLDVLVEDGYSDRYPKIGVAASRFRQLCPNLDLVRSSGDDKDISTSILLGATMMEYRRLRDAALLYGDKEIQVLGKLLSRCDEYFEILVPRMTTLMVSNDDDNRRARPTTNSDSAIVESGDDDDVQNSKKNGAAADVDDTNHDKNNDADSEESDIDWEDGDDFEDEFGNNSDTENGVNEEHQRQLQYHLSHLTAVDRTIAAMKSSLLEGQEDLEIDFSKKRNDNEDTEISNPAESEEAQQAKILARQKLDKVIQKISNVHFPRLKAWLDGLRNSDNMTMESSSSLVILSSDMIRRKVELITIFSNLTQEVSRTIASASRLHIHDATTSQQGNNTSHPQSNQGGSGEDDDDGEGGFSLGNNVRNRNLQGDSNLHRTLFARGTGARRIKSKTTSRSRKIQIKCSR